MAAKTGLPASFVNEGQRALHKSGVKQAIVCEKLKKPRSTVADWFGGKSKPNDVDAARLESWLGITADMFRKGCGQSEPPPRPKSKALANLAATPPEHVEVEALASGRTDGLWPEIDRLRKRLAQPNIPPKEQIAAIGVLGRLHQKQMETEAKAEDLEGGWAKSESFQRLGRAIYAALKPFPDALAAVREVLRD